MSIWFVTPAWKRYEIVAICLEQRQRVIAELAKHGIEAHQVVIADDENLDIARGLGAHVVERDNEMVGRKFNDGIEYAGNHGAEWIVPIGSDSWIATDYFLDLEGPEVTRTSEAYCSVTRNLMARLSVSPQRLEHSAGPYVFHRSLFNGDFRPSEEDSVMVDTSTISGIEKHNPITWKPYTVHPFQYIGFRVAPMMTTHRSLVKRWQVSKHYQPWGLLTRYYPNDLVRRAQKAMSHEAAK